MNTLKHTSEATSELVSVVETLIRALNNAADYMTFKGCDAEAISEARTAADVNCYLKQYGITIKTPKP